MPHCKSETLHVQSAYNLYLIMCLTANIEDSMWNLCAVYKMYKSCGIRISTTTSFMSQYNKSHENLYLVLKIMHTISKCAMRFVYDKIINYHISTKLCQKCFFFAIGIDTCAVHTHNDTDCNKLVIFSSIATVLW